MDKTKLISLNDQQAYTVKSPYVSFNNIISDNSSILLDERNTHKMTNYSGLNEALRSMKYDPLFNSKKIPYVKLTPNKYNGGQVDQTSDLGVKIGQANNPQLNQYTINIDKAEFTLKGFIVDELTGFDLSNEETKREYHNGSCVFVVDGTGGTRFYQYKLDLYFDGQHFAKVLAIPRDTTGKIHSKDSIQLKVLNNIIYESEWIERLQEIIDCLGWKFNNVTGIDIALDGFDLFDKLMTNIDSQIWKFKGRKVDNSIERKGIDKTGFNYGSKASSKWLTVYNKSLLQKINNKKYITDFWEANNLKPYKEGKEVIRLELKLKSKGISKLKDFDWTKLQDGNYLASIMKICFKNWFDVVENTGQKNVSREKKVDLIEWSSFETIRIEKNKTKPPNELYQAKTLIKGMYIRGMKNNNELLKKEAMEMINEYELNEWFDYRIAGWIEKAGLTSKVIELNPVVSLKAN